MRRKKSVFYVKLRKYSNSNNNNNGFADAKKGRSALTRRRNGGGRRAQKVERRERNVAQNGKDENKNAGNDGETVIKDAKLRSAENEKSRKREKNGNRERIIAERGEEIASEQRSQGPRRTATGAVNSGRFAENARGRESRQNARVAINGDDEKREHSADA